MICPARVNLIGDHTDYADGLALPVAVNLFTAATYLKEEGVKSLYISTDADKLYDNFREVTSDKVSPDTSDQLAKFTIAAQRLLKSELHGKIKFTSSIPIGAGLSSSASFSLTLLLTFKTFNDKMVLAKAAQQVEHIATNNQTGLLDQMAIVFAKENFATLINFATETVENIKFPEEIQIIVIHSEVKRQLSNSEYSKRFSSVKNIENIVGKFNNLEVGDLTSIKDYDLFKLARHIVTENSRVKHFASELTSTNYESLGEIMEESHESLSKDYGVSLPQIDELVLEINRLPGVIGSRMTGGGFGGCIVALAYKDAIKELKNKYNLPNRIWYLEPEGGPKILYNKSTL